MDLIHYSFIHMESFSAEHYEGKGGLKSGKFGLT